jgi:hypothetical protein
MSRMFWLVSSAAVMAVFQASTASAAPTNITICYAWRTSVCSAQSADKIVLLQEGSRAPIDAGEPRSKACKGSATTVADKQSGSESDKANFYHYWKFNCEKK